MDKGVKETSEGEYYLHELDTIYPIENTYKRESEEWPSEKWNYQDNYKTIEQSKEESEPVSGDESVAALIEKEASEIEEAIEISQKKFEKLLTSVKGVGKKKSNEVLEKFNSSDFLKKLEELPHELEEDFSWLKGKILKSLRENWSELKEKLSK
ncbi:MAG TPA: hypothetical protein ENL00_03250 [Nitratifractor sp.]|nr:hypothetical protein [Nitratifractor sp.]